MLPLLVFAKQLPHIHHLSRVSLAYEHQVFVFSIHNRHILAGIRQRGSGNALDLFLQRRAESIKRSKTIGTSSEFDKNSRGKNSIRALSLCAIVHL